MKAIHGRQKSYVDVRRKPLEFQVGDKVILNVSHWKAIIRFRTWGKLNMRYIGPFEIFDMIGLITYQLRLPQEHNNLHDVFHVSNLKKWLSDYTLVIQLDKIQSNPEVNSIEELVKMMDREVK